MKYRIAVNSAGRAQTLADKTLAVVTSRNIAQEKITVYTSSEAERDEYRRVLDSTGYEGVAVDFVSHDPLNKDTKLVGIKPLGLGAARNQVIMRTTIGDRLVFVDDDISDIMVAASPTEMKPLEDLEGFFQMMWLNADAASATLWGIYPAANLFFMKKRPPFQYDLCYIIGCLFGVKVTGRSHEYVTLDDKEDFERSIRHYLADGVVLRNNQVTVKSRFYDEAGGMQLSRTEERVTMSAKWLVRRFPDLCKLNTTKKSGHTEVRLRDARKERDGQANDATQAAGDVRDQAARTGG